MPIIAPGLTSTACVPPHSPLAEFTVLLITTCYIHFRHGTVEIACLLSLRPLARPQGTAHALGSSLGPTVFREQQYFEASRGIWPLLRNFRVFAEFHGILRKHGNSTATAKFCKAVLLL